MFIFGANFTIDILQEENDWLEIAGVDYSPPSGVSPRSHRRGRIIRLEREHLYGLIEVEPLPFVCYSASDGIKIENLDTGKTAFFCGGTCTNLFSCRYINDGVGHQQFSTD